MDENSSLSDLLEPSLPGAWIAEHRRIWQMGLLNADKFGSFSHDRGLALFNEKDITQLWQLGLIKADLVISHKKLRLAGLVDHDTDSSGRHIYSDQRQLPRRQRKWGNAMSNLRPLQKEVELLFHPFRYYVLYHLSRVLGLNISKMQMLYQDGFPHVLNSSLSDFNCWAASEQFLSSIRKWNDIASLCVVTEPCSYLRIFNTPRYSLNDVQSRQSGSREICQHTADYWQNNGKKLYSRIGIEQLEEVRTDLCVNTQMLDPNRWIHTLLCLGDSKLRLNLKGHLGGALLLRTMAEMLRRATEEAFDKELPEEDELGLGWVPKGVKETLYGSNRLLNDHQAGETFVRRHGLNYKPRVHLYGEGDTEYGAFNSLFRAMGIPVTNLHGLIKDGKSKESKSMAKPFRDNLRDDIRDHRYSIVLIDGDVPENVRILESAARNNQTDGEDGIFGRYFLSVPDIEFANFEIEELEEILWTWVGGERPSQEERELLHRHVKDAKGSTEFFKGVKQVAVSITRLVGYDKGEAWGEELMKFAWGNHFKQDKKRHLLEIAQLALYWEGTINLERYDEAKKKNMVNPKTGELVTRTTDA